jgi:hypothetical protein
VHEIGLGAVRRAEIEMRAAAAFQEASGAQVCVPALRIDIGPEGAGIGRGGFAGQIGAAFDDRRGEAEIEAGQQGLIGVVAQPFQYGRARPDAARRIDQPGRLVADLT